MKNIVSMLLTLSVVGGTAVMAADEAGKETTSTTETKTKATASHPAHHSKKTVHKKVDKKVDGDKTKTENSTTTESEKK